MTTAMGIAVPSCRAPTSPPASAPPLNCRVPISALALPAVRPWEAMASAEAIGITMPMLAT